MKIHARRTCVVSSQNVSLEFDSHNINFMGDECYLDGEYVQIGSQGHVQRNLGITIEVLGDYFNLNFGQLRIKWDRGSTVMITVEKTAPYREMSRGMCGSYNLNPEGKTSIFIFCSSEPA